MSKLQILLLAAGASKRMGSPKQLLVWGSQTLIEHQIKTLLNTGQTVTVVLGAHAEKISSKLEKLPVAIYINKQWYQGMGSSIAFGLKKILEGDKKPDGILISLIDQPLISTSHFNKIIKQFQSGKEQIIVSQAKDGWIGAPVLFDKKYFEALLNLNDDQGAKFIINEYKSD